MVTVTEITEIGVRGVGMMKTVIGMVLAGALIVGVASAQTGPASKAPRLAFHSLRVSDLNRATDYYRALGFSARDNPGWTTGEEADRLYNTQGARFRAAALTIPSTNSGQLFTLYLREYKDAGGRSRVDFPPRNPSSTHLGLMVPDADNLWAKLQSDRLLRPLSWGGKLIRMPGQTSGGSLWYHM